METLLRSDGTSVYVTQDLGTAKMKFDEHQLDRSIYVVGSEQNYHFQCLFKLLDMLDFEWGVWMLSPVLRHGESAGREDEIA